MSETGSSSGMASTPSRLSTLAKTRMPASPPSAERTAAMSRAERVKDCITAVTPKSRAARRFSQSRGVRGGASYSRPSTVRPLREPRVPVSYTHLTLPTNSLV